MKFLEIKVGSAIVKAELLIEEAPSTVSWLEEVLPLSGRARHSMENGREVFFPIERREPPVPECQTIYQTVGDVLVYGKPAIFSESEWPQHVRDVPVLSVIYDQDSMIRGVSGSLATNRAARVVEGIDLLSVESARMRREGMGDFSARIAIE